MVNKKAWSERLNASLPLNNCFLAYSEVLIEFHILNTQRSICYRWITNAYFIHNVMNMLLHFKSAETARARKSQVASLEHEHSLCQDVSSSSSYNFQIQNICPQHQNSRAASLQLLQTDRADIFSQELSREELFFCNQFV